MSDQWLSLENVAGAQATSEAADHPVAGPLSSPPRGEWRAATPGEQLVEVLFGSPQRVRRIRVVFEETDIARTQEFTLAYSRAGQPAPHEVVRQQFTFSPDGATVETETYELDADNVVAVQLRIKPDISGGPALASLKELRLA